MKTLVAWLLLATACLASDIPVSQRVQNHESGVCWFCCAETLANSMELPTLKGLRDRVVDTQNGTGGATDEKIEQWLALAHVKRRTTTKFDWEFLKRGLKVSPGVIVTLKAWQSGTRPADTHAVILTEMTWTGKEWQFKFIDPNQIESNFSVGQTWFMQKWIGHATYFDKADQPPQALAQKTVIFQPSGIMIQYLPPASAETPR